MDERNWNALPRVNRIFAHVLTHRSRIRWIAVSDNIRNQLVSRGVSDSNINVIPAYLPPLSHETDISLLPSEIQSFASKHAPVLSVYGWRYSQDPDGRDLYGFDQSVKLINTLRDSHLNVGLIICVPGDGDPIIKNKVSLLIDQYGLRNHVLIVATPLTNAMPLWALSDVYLRPTTTDGDAVSVREAISVGVPVVASDSAPRPNVVTTYPLGDIKAFAAAVCSVLDKSTQPALLRIPPSADGYEKVLEVYNQVFHS